MTRSTARTRLASLALVGVLVGPGSAGCSTTTASDQLNQEPNAGANLDVRLVDGSGFVRIRNAVIVPSAKGGYAAADTVPLAIGIFNDSPKPVTVSGVQLIADPTPLPGAGRVTGRVVLVGGQPPALAPGTTPSGSGPATPGGTQGPLPTPADEGTGASPSGSRSAGISESPGGSPSAGASTPGNPSSRDSASPGPSATGSASPSATGSVPAGAGPVSFTIPANSYVALQPPSGHYLALTGLSQALGYGSTAGLQLNIGNQKITMTIGFDTMETALPRTPLDLHGDEE